MSSGADVCREMAAGRSQKQPDCGDPFCSLGRIASGVGEAISGGLANILGASNKNISTTITMLENSMSDVSRQTYEKKCENEANYNQENIIDNLQCITALGCNEPMPDLSKYTPELAKSALRAYEAKQSTCQELISGKAINQTNNLSSTQNCVIDGVIQILSKEKLDSNLLMLYEKSLAAKGLAAANKNDSSNCTNINNKIDKQTYIDSVQRCYNKLNLNQKNVANCARNVNQTNIATMLQDCLLQEEVLNDSTKEITSDVKIEDKTTMKAEGLTLGFLAMIFLIIILIVGAGFLMKKKK